jgi:hypothetical protein
MNQYDIKSAKWGIIFFTEPATLKIDTTKIVINKKDGSELLASGFNELKKVNVNTINGMWTIAAKNGQRCNVIIKDEQAINQLGAALNAADVKGFSV